MTIAPPRRHDGGMSDSPTQPADDADGPRPPAGPPFSPPPAGPAYAAPPGRRPGALWREATSTTGGRVATVLAGVLLALLVLAGVGLGAVAIGRLGHDRGPVGAMQPGRGHGAPGPGRMDRGGDGSGDRMGPFGERRRPQDGDGLGERRDPGAPLGGPGGMAGPSGILHGEFVTGSSGSSTRMLVQVGEVTAYTKGASLAVTSADGFATTYTIDSASRLVGSSATSIRVGDTVRVLATKRGPTVTTVQIVSAGGSSGA